MYQLFLDDTMTYSCGVWDGPDCDLRQVGAGGAALRLCMAFPTPHIRQSS